MKNSPHYIENSSFSKFHLWSHLWFHLWAHLSRFIWGRDLRPHEGLTVSFRALRARSSSTRSCRECLIHRSSSYDRVWDAWFLDHLRRIKRSTCHWAEKRLHFEINKLTIRIDLKAIDSDRVVAYAENQVVSYIWKSDDAESRDQEFFRFLTSSLHLIIQQICTQSFWTSF
jgi:hypothetical protein